MICQMCEKELIRFRHHMQHVDYTDLFVGCICAGDMEGNRSAAKDREKAAKSAARKGPLKPWEGADTVLTVLYQRVIRSYGGWKRSQNGNPYRKTIGYMSTVFVHGDGWKFVVKNLETDDSHFYNRTYLKVSEAKKAALIHVAHIRMNADRDPRENRNRRIYDYHRQMDAR